MTSRAHQARPSGGRRPQSAGHPCRRPVPARALIDILGKRPDNLSSVVQQILAQFLAEVLGKRLFSGSSPRAVELAHGFTPCGDFITNRKLARAGPKALPAFALAENSRT